MEDSYIRFPSEEDDGIDQQSEAFDGYCQSADVSESESYSTTDTFSPRVASASASWSTSTQLNSSSDSDFPALPTVLLPVIGGEHVEIQTKKPQKTQPRELSEAELMKERFAKLLLGEDMSGGGRGVCTALAISNAITNLAASVFGELWKMEPLAPEKKSMWLREMDWLLCVSDYIVELVPSVQEFPGGGSCEVMVTQSRSDLSVNLPALKQLDTALISILDGFRDTEFYYVDRGVVVADGEYIEAKPSSGRPSMRLEEKWWLPFPKVPPNGLSVETRELLQQCRECTNQIYKAAAEINSSVLAEMEIPQNYLDELDKGAKACLGEILYRYITANQFYPECLLDYTDIPSEYKALEIANRIEAALHIWRQKYQKTINHKKGGKSSWSATVKGRANIEKAEIYAKRAETLLRNLKLYFPGLRQTALDTIKIEYNKDVGQAIVESYSRVMEGLAFNLTARIDDLLYVDNATRRRAATESEFMLSHKGSAGALALQKQVSRGLISLQLDTCASFVAKPAFSSAACIVRKPKRSHSSFQ